MLILRIAVRNLLRHLAKTFLIGSLIAFGTALLFCANAVFESSSKGLETSFIGSLTGNFAVSALSEEAFGIFGSEVPIVSDYQNIPPIAGFTAVEEALGAEPSIQQWTRIVSAAAQVNIGGYVVKSPVFGVDAASYFAVCSDLVVENGEPSLLGKGGVFLNADLAKSAEEAIGRPLSPGEPIVFSMFTNGSFRVRRGTFSGIYRYPAPIGIMSKIVLTDPAIVRSLCDYTMGYAVTSRAQPERVAVEPTTDFEDLFSGTDDIVTESRQEFSLTDLEAELADTSERNAMIMTDAAAWSFALARVQPGADADVVRRGVARTLTQKLVEVRVLDWRTTAGSSALMLFAVRAAFNLGIGILILGASLIVMNALVISVLERTNEIGAMRALGAGRSFIRALFILETMIQTVVSALVGIACGAVLLAILARRGIPLTNPLLITLFGGTSIHPIVTIRALLSHLVGIGLIGSLAWIYPVSIALRIQPVAAMADR